MLIEHPYDQAFPPFCHIPLLPTKNHPVLSNYSVKTRSLALSLALIFLHRRTATFRSGIMARG
jgi:hypothetical protein